VAYQVAPSGAPTKSERSTRSRRLRKKLHVDEFREDGFRVRFTLHALSAAEAHRFWDDLLAEAIEVHGLTWGGGEDGFVMPARGSATDAHREAVRAWLAARPEVASVDVGPLVDAWHDARSL
jgi:hypothetical protein